MLTDNPVLTEQARTGGFTNEGGVGGKIRLLQNITGLWILQELMAGWKAAGEGMSYPELVGQSRESSCATVIDVDDPVFATSTDMQQTIVDYCRANGLAVPASKGDFGRCVMLSLADRYRRGIEALNAMLPEPVKYLRIIGGGSRNELQRAYRRRYPSAHNRRTGRSHCNRQYPSAGRCRRRGYRRRGYRLRLTPSSINQSFEKP